MHRLVLTRIAPAALVFALAGCTLFGADRSQAPAGGGAAAAPVIPDESKTQIREQERRGFMASSHDPLERPEKDVKKALELSLGQVAAYQGGPKPYRASEAILALRKAKIDLRLEPVRNQDGEAVGDNFVMLKDSYTDRVQELSRKIAEQKATKREMKEIQRGSKYVVKLNDVKSQVTAFSLPAMQSGWLVTSTSLTTMLTASQMVRTRRTYEMQWNDEDYEIVQAKLADQRRAESIAAISIGMLAAYQAVLDGADPKALDAIAEESLKAFPLETTATLDEAKAYVDGLGDNIAATKEKYETQMRKAYGDQLYEKNYKAGIDAMFKQAEDAMNAKSVGQMVAEAQEKAAQQRAAAPARTGPSTNGNAGALAAVASGNTGAMVDGATQMLPSDGPIGASLAGVQAIRNKDPRGAIKAAIELVPAPGPVKAGLSIASKLLDVVPKVKRRKKSRA